MTDAVKGENQNPGLDIKGLVLSLLINVGLPLLVIQILTSYMHTSEITALSIASIIPVLNSVREVMSERKLDLIAIFFLLGIITNIVAILMGGNVQLLVIRESFFSGALGLACFISLLLPRPLMFYVGRQMLAGKDPVKLAGIQHLGMITGRVGPEVDSALERMLAYSGEQWWEVVISASAYAKPNPQALRAAIDTVGARGGLYIGDTADDHDLVRNYYATRSASEPDILAAMLVGESERETYIQRGADVLVRSVEDLLELL